MLGNIGRSVSLPCNTTASAGRTASLVMWFKGRAEDPFYSLDLRRQNKTVTVHWAADSWAGRVNFIHEKAIF